MNTERINQDIFIELETTEDFRYFVLAKHVTRVYFCGDGYFYDPYEDKYLEKTASDYILYYDNDGNKLEKPIEVKVEWRATNV